jgi:hypothetical protein|nr:MAG TPA: hypothetical protein [Caudoviricetes sp.]
MSQILNSKNFKLVNDRYDKYIDMFMDKLKNEAARTNDPIYKQLYIALDNLYNRGQFKIHFIDANKDSDRMIKYTYGYYSAFKNSIYLVVDKDNFESKWFGVATDYDNFTEKSIKSFVVTCTHELMHYCSNTYYESFVKIWRQTMYTHIWNVFKHIIDRDFYEFVDPISAHNFSQKDFLESADYKATFDAYFNSIMINIKFRLQSLNKRYNDILSTLYSKQKFMYARFFDNVLVSTIKLHEGVFNDTSMKIYHAIQSAYYDMAPSFRNIKMYSMFYQELFDFSEVACIFATYAKWAPDQMKLVLKTLQLIQ